MVCPKYTNLVNLFNKKYTELLKYPREEFSNFTRYDRRHQITFRYSNGSDKLFETIVDDFMENIKVYIFDLNVMLYYEPQYNILIYDDFHVTFCKYQDGNLIEYKVNGIIYKIGI